MWRSPLFWRTFLIGSLIWLAGLGILLTITETYSDEQRFVWKIATVTGLIVLLLTLTLARFLAPSLKELRAAADSIAQGQFGQKVYGAQTEEVKTLARSFNHMS